MLCIERLFFQPIFDLCNRALEMHWRITQHSTNLSEVIDLTGERVVSKVKPITLPLFYSIALLLTCGSVQASNFLCSATQESFDKPALLGEECPIGVSLWGKSKPIYAKSTFWIQCGFFPEELTLEQVNQIYPNVSSSIWNKAEKKGKRCLIGPYDDFAQASLEVTQLRTVSGFEKSFIREVEK